jgi:type 1 glutamine amidotransferase
MVQNGWPKDPAATFKDAKAVVFYMNGGGEQTTTAHAEEIDKLAAAGVGIVHVHQVIDYPSDFAPHAAKWLGGAYNAKTGGSRGHWDASFDTFPESPVTRGVTPFKMNDGFILNITFDDSLVKGVTPILRARNPKAKEGQYAKPLDDVICWTCERPDGGRSFVMTPGDGHKNWGLEGYRKLMINGILWAAKVEIPKDGAPVKLDPADLMQNMDHKTGRPPVLKLGKPAEKKGDGAAAVPVEK